MAASMMTTMNLARPTSGLPAMRRNTSAVRPASRMVVRAEADDKAPKIPSDPPTNDVQAAMAEDNAKAAAQFGGLMSFTGPAPEIINGRLAMVGFVTALGAELATGETVVQQYKDHPVLVVGTFLLFAAASLIPMFKGKGGKVENGPFTKKAEMYNGRLAMIGFAAMLLTERFIGTAVF